MYNNLYKTLISMRLDDDFYLPVPCDMFVAREDGDVKIEDITKSVVTINCKKGQQIFISVIKFFNTDTTVSNIIGYFKRHHHNNSANEIFNFDFPNQRFLYAGNPHSPSDIFTYDYDGAPQPFLTNTDNGNLRFQFHNLFRNSEVFTSAIENLKPTRFKTGFLEGSGQMDITFGGYTNHCLKGEVIDLNLTSYPSQVPITFTATGEVKKAFLYYSELGGMVVNNTDNYLKNTSATNPIFNPRFNHKVGSEEGLLVNGGLINNTYKRYYYKNVDIPGLVNISTSPGHADPSGDTQALRLQCSIAGTHRRYLQFPNRFFSSGALNISYFYKVGSANYVNVLMWAGPFTLSIYVDPIAKNINVRSTLNCSVYGVKIDQYGDWYRISIYMNINTGGNSAFAHIVTNNLTPTSDAHTGSVNEILGYLYGLNISQ